MVDLKNIESPVYLKLYPMYLVHSLHIQCISLLTSHGDNSRFTDEKTYGEKLPMRENNFSLKN